MMNNGIKFISLFFTFLWPPSRIVVNSFHRFLTMSRFFFSTRINNRYQSIFSLLTFVFSLSSTVNDGLFIPAEETTWKSKIKRINRTSMRSNHSTYHWNEVFDRFLSLIYLSTSIFFHCDSHLTLIIIISINRHSFVSVRK